jgi:hypothetical protein
MVGARERPRRAILEIRSSTVDGVLCAGLWMLIAADVDIDRLKERCQAFADENVGLLGRIKTPAA